MFNNDSRHSFWRPRCHIVTQCSSWFSNSRKLVPCVTLPDLEGHQYWQGRKCWKSQTACSKVRRSPSGNYLSRLVSHMARPIQLKKKSLCLYPYKITAVHELKLGDSAKRVVYCKWFLDFLDREGEDILDVTFFTDEAYFHSLEYINSQNSSVWCAHNPHVFHESPLHDEKIGVWVGMSRRRMVGPTFSRRLSTPNDTVTILCIPSLHNWKKMKLTRPAFSRMALRLIQHICLWRSWMKYLRTESFLKSFELQDLRIFLHPNFFSGVRWKTQCTYSNNPHTIDELKMAITEYIRNVDHAILNMVFKNTVWRVNKCLETCGGHFEHYL